MVEQAEENALKSRYFKYHFRCILYHPNDIPGAILHCRKSRLHVSSQFFMFLWHTRNGIYQPQNEQSAKTFQHLTGSLRWDFHGRQRKTGSEFSAGRLSWIPPSPQMFCDTLGKTPGFHIQGLHNKLGRCGTATSGTDSEVLRWDSVGNQAEQTYLE